MSKMEITKAVIACGGLGTRFLPITKAVPKELLPIVDRPVLAYIVDEAIASGATDILIILSREKEAVRNYFAPQPQLEKRLLMQGSHELYSQLAAATPKARISYAYQQSPCGSGDALLYAQDFTGDEPFFLSYADDLICGDTPALAQLKSAYEEGAHVVGVKRVLGEEIGLYGAAKITGQLSDELYLCGGFEEKKPFGQAPSDLAVAGRYLFEPQIYDQLRRTRYVEGELRLTDALSELCRHGRVYAVCMQGARFDCGDKFGALAAAITIALRGEFSQKLKKFLGEVGEEGKDRILF